MSRQRLKLTQYRPKDSKTARESIAPVKPGTKKYQEYWEKVGQMILS